MPSVSKAQKTTASMAKAIQAGELPATPGTPAADMANSMKPSDLNEFASTPTKGLPAHAPKSKRKSPVKMVGKAVQQVPI